jgi:poly(A) polymerase
VLTRCDCTTRNEKKAVMLSRRMDDLEQRIIQLAAQEELQAIRPELDGAQVMAHLGLAPSPLVGKAMKFLLNVRLEEGPLGESEIYARLDQWWSEQNGVR